MLHTCAKCSFYCRFTCFHMFSHIVHILLTRFHKVFTELFTRVFTALCAMVFTKVFTDRFTEVYSGAFTDAFLILEPLSATQKNCCISNSKSGIWETYPPAPRCRDSDQVIYVGEWMVPRCYGINNSEKRPTHHKKTRKFESVFEKRRRFSKPRALIFFM